MPTHLKDKAGNINFKNIYKGVSHTDFNRRPVVKGELYTVNLTKATVTLMYDDRGCDLVSADIELLKKYHEQLSDLVLEVNCSVIHT